MDHRYSPKKRQSWNMQPAFYSNDKDFLSPPFEFSFLNRTLMKFVIVLVSKLVEFFSQVTYTTIRKAHNVKKHKIKHLSTLY